ncbi:BRO1 domain-containing protein BROX-like [Brevipalpus obovatus]|uniref:BRO1 domain-containing protein BROX-like n=1 Tax=Brevipalpus obovatus TaxID=246614 RepID=UPI003D9F683A
MTFWFHRNPLKHTIAAPFDLKFAATNAEAVKICSELRKTREKLIEGLSGLDSDETTIETLFTEYLSLLRGFYENADPTGGDTSKLRGVMKFKWSHSMLGSTLMSQIDVIYEVISICQEYAFWLMKRTSLLVMKASELSEDQLKKIHKDLRRASGVILEMKSNFIPLLENRDPAGSDLDTKVLDAYICQCMAEAQEVTIHRAIALKHSSSLIAALTNETSQKFLEAAIQIKALEISKFGKWMHYLQIKCCCYNALTYSFYGDNLLAMEKCGEGVKCCQEAAKKLEVLAPLCKEYSKMKGQGAAPKLEQTAFFQHVRATVNRLKDKCERENTLIFHHKLPLEVPKLELKATHGLVAPDEFKMPAISSYWTPFACTAFEQMLMTMMKNLSLDESPQGKEKSPKKDKKDKKEKKSPK